ncbi:MAG: ABC transporter permease [Planctomycetes bacterium]|nr:ABC transporter permease [Planctomycetota bacterium]
MGAAVLVARAPGAPRRWLRGLLEAVAAGPPHGAPRRRRQAQHRRLEPAVGLAVARGQRDGRQRTLRVPVGDRRGAAARGRRPRGRRARPPVHAARAVRRVDLERAVPVQLRTHARRQEDAAAVPVPADPARHRRPRSGAAAMNVFAKLGGFLLARVDSAGYVVDLLVRAIGSLHRLPRRLRFTLDMAFNAGVRSLPVTMVVAAFAGAILAMQTGIELRRFGDTAVLGTITALSMCREMGPFITGVILAATVGSSMAAELGTMQVSDEVSALEVMSVDPVDYLVLPRVVALAIMCPLLTVLSNLVGIYGGSVIAEHNLGVSPDLFWQSAREALTSSGTLLPKEVYVGLFKAFVFGTAIATVSCASGLRASGGALGVGLAVQAAVRNSVILIIVLGFIVTWFFYFLTG